MKIADKSAFLDHKKILNVELINGGGNSYVIALNIPVGCYYKIMCLAEQFEESQDINEKYLLSAEITEAILKLSDSSINTDWIIKNISIENQLDIISSIMEEINKLLENDAFKIPNIEVKAQAPKSKTEKDKEKAKNEIQKLTAILEGYKDIYLIEDITVLLTKTNIGYFEILKMPILIFKDIIKTIVLNENRADDEYNLAYLKNEYNNIKTNLNEETINKMPAQIKGADTKKLKALLS